MKNYKKRNAGLNLRIASIVLVTMVATTLLWAKPKKVEYSPFKSENPNATVFECELIPGCDEVLQFYCNTSYSDFNIAVEVSSVAVYGWKKKKGGWEKLGEYQSEGREWNAEVLDDDCDKYTRYAVEFEAPENIMTLSRIKSGYDMHITLELSANYKNMLDEKRAAERAEQERLAEEEQAEKERLAAEEKAQEKAKRNAERDAKAKALAKGYVFHGIDENDRNRKLFTGGALEAGHAYYISGFVVKYGGTMAAIEYADGLFFSSRSSAVYVDYIDQKLKGEIVEAGITTLLGTTIESPLSVVVAGGKAPLHTPVVIGLVE
ncbi:MAG: WVD2 family protein [Treponemataceae bacterium]|nr:WVD2 family protein [Treponemataceae bacterium]